VGTRLSRRAIPARLRPRIVLPDTPSYPCLFDPGDVPFLYYSQFLTNNYSIMRDYTQLTTDIANAALPDVSYVKAIGYKTEGTLGWATPQRRACRS